MLKQPRTKQAEKSCKPVEATLSVATVITNVFQKKQINVSNKFVRIMKIFTKINDLKNCGVI